MKRKNKKSNWKALLLSLTRLELSLRTVPFQVLLLQWLWSSSLPPVVASSVPPASSLTSSTDSFSVFSRYLSLEKRDKHTRDFLLSLISFRRQVCFSFEGEGDPINENCRIEGEQFQQSVPSKEKGKVSLLILSLSFSVVSLASLFFKSFR